MKRYTLEKKLDTESQMIISFLNRLLTCMQIKELYVYNVQDGYLKGIYPNINIIDITDIRDIDNKKPDLMFCIISNPLEKEKILFLKQYSDFTNFVVLDLISENLSTSNSEVIYCEKMIFDKNRRLVMYGPIFEKRYYEDDNFKVLAILHLYNEEDVIKKTIEYLLCQGLFVYVLDNWSTDNSYEIAKKCVSENPGKVFLHRFPESGGSNYYDWYLQLEKTEQLSCELDFDWFIHYDCDEFRVSPWKNCSLKEFIFNVDQLGYNCIENTVIDFRITENEQENIFMEDTYFDFRYNDIMFDQVKTWKKCSNVDLKSSGGHFVRVDNPVIFPLKILNRHYPLRCLSQAKKKVYQDRLPRFEKENRERGWHGHYRNLEKDDDFIYNKDKLFLWKDSSIEELYVPLFTECGIKKEYNYSFMFDEEEIFRNKKIIIYGAGKAGIDFVKQYNNDVEIVGWVDKDYMRIPNMFGHVISKPESIIKKEYDVVLICIKKIEIQKEIKENLLKMGVKEKKVVELKVVNI